MSRFSASAEAGASRALRFSLGELMLVVSWLAVALGLSLRVGLGAACIWLAVSSAAAAAWAARRKNDRWIAVGTWGIVTAIALGMVLGFELVFQASPDCFAPRPICKNNLRQLNMALQLYHDTYGSFPPPYVADASGRPMHSWRVLILPFIEQAPLYKQYRFDEPWDGPHNRKLHDAIVPAFSCPAHDAQMPPTEASYLAVIGPETIWPGDRPVRMADNRRWNVADDRAGGSGGQRRPLDGAARSPCDANAGERERPGPGDFELAPGRGACGVCRWKRALSSR
jgi:hypothetical protein